MSLPPTNPASAAYVQPSVNNSAQRDAIAITADGNTRVTVQRRDAAGNILENIVLLVPAAGGAVTDTQGRVYGNVVDGSFTTAIASICSQVDTVVSQWAAAGKFNR